jgi:UPF0755 protein
MKKGILIGLGILVLLAGAATLITFLWARSYATTPMVGTGVTVAVDVPAGTGPKKAAGLLAEKKVIDDPELFTLYVRYYRRAAGELKAGELAFRDNMTPEEALQVLLEGTPITHKITIAEGLRIDEIARAYDQEGLADAGAFEKRAREPEFVRSLNVPGDSLEGFLFPETYAFRKHTPLDEILEDMVAQYRKVYTPEFAERAKVIGMSELEVVTLASIVEKETGAPQERPLIAGLFHNRLKQNWRLDTDPTVIYAEILATGSFDGKVHETDLKRNHPYNTYLHKGLPPGPICSPGAEAIKAVLWPAQTDYMFFVSKNDGTHFFCKDIHCHNQAVAKYQRGGTP